MRRDSICSAMRARRNARPRSVARRHAVTGLAPDVRGSQCAESTYAASSLALPTPSRHVARLVGRRARVALSQCRQCRSVAASLGKSRYKSLRGALAEKGSARGGCREVRVRPSPPTLGSRAALEACWRGDAMTASAVFILDVKGKVVISRNYRGDVPMNCVERFAGAARAPAQ